MGPTIDDQILASNWSEKTPNHDESRQRVPEQQPDEEEADSQIIKEMRIAEDFTTDHMKGSLKT